MKHQHEGLSIQCQERSWAYRRSGWTIICRYGLFASHHHPLQHPSVLFGKKPDRRLRLCIEYMDIHCQTIENWYPVTLICETLNLLQKAWMYTQLEVWGVYNLVQTKEGDENMFAFWTRYGLSEPRDMQFGTTNAPADFQGYINNTIREALDNFVWAYLDDILIYSDLEEEHKQHVKWVMWRLLEAGLYLKPEKCEFHIETVRCLGLIILTKGISMDQGKVETVRNRSWEKKTENGRLNKRFQVQLFLWFCDYYRWVIPMYSEKVAPLTRLRWQDELFRWEAEQPLAVDNILTTFATATALQHFNQEREVIIETDASYYVSAGVLSQYDDEEVLHPVAYCSKQYTPVECNYDIYDKELMTIINVLEEWRPECECTAYLL